MNPAIISPPSFAGQQPLTTAVDTARVHVLLVTIHGLHQNWQDRLIPAAEKGARVLQELTTTNCRYSLRY